MAGRRIKCRWCEQTYPVAFTRRNGRLVSGYEVLLDHCIREHPLLTKFLGAQSNELIGPINEASVAATGKEADEYPRFE